MKFVIAPRTPEITLQIIRICRSKKNRGWAWLHPDNKKELTVRAFAKYWRDRLVTTGQTRLTVDIVNGEVYDCISTSAARTHSIDDALDALAELK